mgnify:CR=1 FL=1
MLVPPAEVLNGMLVYTPVVHEPVKVAPPQVIVSELVDEVTV